MKLCKDCLKYKVNHILTDKTKIEVIEDIKNTMIKNEITGIALWSYGRLFLKDNKVYITIGSIGTHKLNVTKKHYVLEIEDQLRIQLKEMKEG